MQDLSNFADTYDDWNFTSVWSPPNQAGQNGGSAAAYYPELYALSRVVAVAPNDAATVYGTPAQTPIAQYYGLRASDFLTAPATIAGASAAGDADDYPLTASGARASNPAYRFVYLPATLTVTPAPLTVTANDLTRVYDGAAFTGNGVTYDGFVNSENESVLGGSPIYGGNALGAVNAGEYTIAVSGLTSGNYAIAYIDGTLTINRRALTVSAVAQTRIYGDDNPDLTYTAAELIEGDTLTGELTTDATPTSIVGPYAIALGSLTASDNYALTYQGANLTVTPADLTVTYAAAPVSSIYGDTPSLTGTVSAAGLKNGDGLESVTSGAAIWTSAADATSDVGAYAVAGSGLAGDSGNYRFSFAQDAANATALTIAPRALTVTADALSRIYGDTNPALTFAITEGMLVNGDALSGDLATNATAASNIGAYAITQGSLAASSNYALTYRGANLTVTPADLIVTYGATPVSSLYGDAPLLTGIVNAVGLKNGDLLESVTDGTAAWTSAADATSHVGVYAVTGSGLAGDSGNYRFSFVQGAANATALSITPRALTVTADALSRIYGDANPALTYNLGGLGLVNGDTLTGALATSATAASDVGAYAITQGNLAATANYALSYTGATLIIDPAALTVTYAAAPATSIYGNMPSLTGTVRAVGLKNGDTLAAVTNGAAAWTSPGGPTSDIGSYAVAGSGLAGDSGNYRFSFVQDATNATALSITPRALTVTADVLSRIYGDANPALTYRVGGLGLVNGDTLTGALATAATTASDVGAYAIAQGSLSATSNYALTYQAADLTVTPADLIVTYGATPVSSLYGDAPLLTGMVHAVGLKNGDLLESVTNGAASWTSAADATSDIGVYAVTGRGLAGDSGNYRFSFVQGAANATALSITPRALTVTADTLSRLYGDANPALTYRIGGLGLVNGDSLSGAPATSATRSSIPGSYAIVQGTLAASANYALRFVPGVLTILRVEPMPAVSIASTLARDAFAMIANPLAGSDAMSSIAGLFPPSDDGISGQTGAAATPMEAHGLHCLRKRPCPASGSAPQ
nr:MBG domain-containing protein [Sphingopyxis panaciterrulae]